MHVCKYVNMYVCGFRKVNINNFFPLLYILFIPYYVCCDIVQWVQPDHWIFDNPNSLWEDSRDFRDITQNMHLPYLCQVITF